MAQPPVDTSKAADFWRSNLDPQNLDQGSDSGVSLEDELAFVATPDFEEAWKFIKELRAQGGEILRDWPSRADTFFARAGDKFIVADPSSRMDLRVLKSFIEDLGCGDHALFVAARENDSPFKQGSLDSIALTQRPEDAWEQLMGSKLPANQIPKSMPLPLVVDIGAGLGACSIVMERRGATVIAMDTSLPRLRQLGNRAKQAGGGEKILRVVASAEHLPFKSHSIPAAFTKSVLIHTDLEKAADEIGRILALGGGAALIEPMKRNPFAWLYRKTLAPREWQGITHYFDEDMQWKICASKIAGVGGTEVKPFYLFSFLAFIFQFAIPQRKLFFGLLALIHALDRGLFSLFPFLKRFAWFGVILCNARGVPSESQVTQTRQT